MRAAFTDGPASLSVRKDACTDLFDTTGRWPPRDADAVADACGLLSGMLASPADDYATGAYGRALRLFKATDDTGIVMSALVDDALRYVTHGAESADEERRLLDAVEERLHDGIREMAALLDVEVEDLDGLGGDIWDDFCLAVPRKATRAEFGAHGFKIVSFHYNTDEPQTIMDVVTGELWDEENGFRALPTNMQRRVGFMEAEDRRAASDRLVRLRAAIEATGLELREDSSLCAAFVYSGTYEGPDHEWPGAPADALGKVVEMMREMAFLFERTTYSRMAEAARTCTKDASCASDTAKRAAVYCFIRNRGGHPADLPPRLRHALESETDGDVEGWREVYDNVERMKHEADAYWDEYYENISRSDSWDDEW